jgi:hypothetical protein
MSLQSARMGYIIALMVLNGIDDRAGRSILITHQRNWLFVRLLMAIVRHITCTIKRVLKMTAMASSNISKTRSVVSIVNVTGSQF